MRVLLSTILVLFSLNLLAEEHGHHHHNWLEDKEAFAYTQAYENKFFENLFAKTERKFSLINKSSLENGISVEFIKLKLEQLSGVKPVVINGRSININERGSATGRNNALLFLQTEYEKLGFQVSYDKFSNGANLVAEKKGFDPNGKILILSSHMDSVSNAGANDNGTGTISALAVARALAGMSFKNTLRILAFDKEESGLIGSSNYVKKLSNKSQIIGNINYEMMGTNSRQDGAFHIIDCNKPTSTFLTQSLLNSIQTYQLPLVHNPGCTTRSDHASFWNAGIPAVVISENFFGGDSDRCYHRSCDVVDNRLNFEYIKNITIAAYGAVFSLLQK